MKLSNWIQLLLLVLLILLGIIAAKYDRIQLSKCSKESKAIIINKNKRKGRGYVMKYEYYVNNSRFTTSESLKKKIEVQSFNIGDTISIMYGCHDSNVSKFLKIE